MASEFKIGRLRFTWSGAWQPGTVYARDSVVSYQGKTYVCLLPNTASSNFYNDLYYVTQSGASTPYWALIVDGKKFVGAWTTSTLYSLGNIAIFGGYLYYCNTTHTSSAFTTDASKWTIYTEFTNWHISWQPATVYGLGDVVKYGGVIYTCTANHTSAATLALGLEANQSAWTTMRSGLEYKGSWTSNFRYKFNDIVKNGPDLYICNTYNSDSTWTPANWALWMPGFEYAGTWDANTTYMPGDTVQYGGYTYVSKTQNNFNNIPSLDAVDWALFTQGYEWKAEWTNGVQYKIGDVVRRHGMLYVAKADTISNDPAAYLAVTTYNPTGSSGTTLVVASTAGVVPGMYVVGNGFTIGQVVTSVTNGTTLVLSAAPDGTLNAGQTLSFSGVNYLYWTIINPGTYWTKTWVNGTVYSVGDLAVWQNNTYVCITSHTGSYSPGSSVTNNRPDTDTNNLYWVYYVPHARKNAMNTYGDLGTYDGVSPTYSAVAIGTQQYVLRNTGGTPTWTKINVVPSVYYVSNTTGTDRGDYGVTWDQPWKTIRYACQQLINGTQYPNAVALLQANKAWLIAEMIQWTRYQIANNIAPYSGYSLNQTLAIRDAGYIIDAITYDIGRGGNSQTVAATLAYFDFGNTNAFYSTAVKNDVPYYLPMLARLGTLIANALTQTTPASSYQTLMNIAIPEVQAMGMASAETSVTISTPTMAANLLSIVTTALTNGNANLVPPANTGISATIFVKTGTYLETLPIVVPENVAIVGDELRGVVVQPKVALTMSCTGTTPVSNLFTVNTTTGLTDKMPVQFASPTIAGAFTYAPFGGITIGQTYYVVGSTITSTQFAVTTSTSLYTNLTSSITSGTGTGARFSAISNSNGTFTVTMTAPGSGYAVNDTIRILGTAVGAATPANDILITVATVDPIAGVILTFTSSSSALLTLTGGTGTIASNTYMKVYAGDSLQDMFRMRNGTGLRNMTLSGLVGALSAPNVNLLQKPTGGSFACLDPGSGPNDTTTWIFRRSPFVQNCTAFGSCSTGLKIDGNLHNGGNKSMVANDFTHIISDGIGVWCTGPNSLTEIVSVFSYYGYAGYFAEGGGRIRATNGNTSYGQYGVIASGYDASEVPATGIVFNQSTQVQATVQSAFGSNSQLLRMNYSNAGSNYASSTTNILGYSNNFLGANWTGDSNVLLTKNITAPTGLSEAWTLTGTTAGPDGSYIYQNMAVPAAGATYTNISAVNISGSGNGATFNVTVTSTAYVVTVNSGGTGYVTSNQMFISGGQLGGINSVNDCIITVANLAGSAILTVTASGTVPTNSALNYTCSVYVKKGTAPTIDLYGIFSGSSTVTSSIRYNFDTNTITPSSANGGFLPTQYGAINQQLSSSSPTAGWYRLWFAVNDTTGLNTQLQFRIYPRGYSGAINQYTYFYGAQTELSSSTYTPSFYLEVASTSKYTAYANYNVTGAGTSVAVIGDEIRAGSVFQTRVATDSNGVTGGAGYLTASNNAQSGTTQYVQLAQSDTNSSGNYTGMRVFLNSGTGAGQYGYISAYDSSTKIAYVLKESFTSLQVVSTSSGTNQLTLSNSYNTDSLYVDQPVQFIPTYYNTSVSSTNLSQATVTAATGGQTNTFTVSSTVGLNVNTPITFSAGVGQSIFSSVSAGYTYYIYAILDSVTIQVSQSLYGTIWQLNTAVGAMTMNFSSNTNYLQASSSNMVVNYPIQFTGTALGGLSVGTVYYINDIIDANNFTVAGSLVNVSVTATSSSTNGLTVASTSSIIPLNPIVFTAPTIGNIVDGTKYYISKVIDSTTFTVSNSLITTTATATAVTSNLITVGSTAGFVVNQPIQFVGTTFGGIVSETTYYILAINNSTTFTISQSPGGSAVGLTSATGAVTVRTCPTPFVLSTATGTMPGVSTSKKTALSLGIGTMTATFSTSLYGNAVLGTTYYIRSIDDTLNFTITATKGSGTPVSLATKAGSMNIAAVGWDHINPGTSIVNALDNSTVYYIEPKTTFSAPSFTQSVATNVITLAGGTSYVSMAYGNNYWLALPNGNATAAGSSDGTTWTSIALPSTQTWSSIAYGNGFWVAVAQASNTVIRSPSNGAGWRTSSMPLTANWNQMVYGNGKFVATISDNATMAYSTDYGNTWTLSSLPSDQTITVAGSTKLSNTQAKLGTTSLSLNGTTDYISFASSTDFGFGTGDFTLEGYFYHTTGGSFHVLFDTRSVGTETSVMVAVNASDKIYLYINGSVVTTTTASLSVNAWTHVAVVRSSGSTSIYVNGTQSGTPWADSTNYGSSKPMRIGADYANANYYPGYIDELRISKGIARYTSTFTPTLVPFVTDSSTKVLMHFDGANNSTTITSTAGTWTSVAYGLGRYVAVESGTANAAYSLDGITWTRSTLPSSTSWSSIAYGQGIFVAVSTANTNTAYSSDGGVTWTSSNITISANLVSYGQGVFVALNSSNTTAYTSEDGSSWQKRAVTNDGYGAIAFGFASGTNVGKFPTLGGSSNGSVISAGCRTKGRASITSNVITQINEWEPGSGYTTVPTVSFTDPNVTTLAVVTPRLANGVLSSPGFQARGSGYNSNSTVVTVSGNGYADQYQTGLTVILNNLSRLPSPGDNLTITGVSQVYKVTNAYAVYNTVAPNLEANVSVSPAISTANATANGTAVSIRSKYSQARLTNHDFLNVGYGDFDASNYPGYPDEGYAALSQNQSVEVDYGRVFFTSTDQDGNFKVGNLFGVQQATGIVTLSASQFGLTGLSSLSLGGIAVGGSSVTITQFSTDGSFTSNSDSVIPTQRAIKTYLTSRLSQGGANTFTGQLIAGTVVVGGPNIIRSSIPNGTTGSVVKMVSKVMIQGAQGGVDGNLPALGFFMTGSSKR